MFYLSRLTINHSRIANGWLSNPYRIHQRLKMACPGDPRVLFRLEIGEPFTRLLVQSQTLPDWAAAFNQLPVLQGLPEVKSCDPHLIDGEVYAFRLQANPTIKRNGSRIGIIGDEAQYAWLEKHLMDAGGKILRCLTQPFTIQRSMKSEEKGASPLTHLVVQYDGLLLCQETEKLQLALAHGIGPAKGFGCGLLSLAHLV